MRKRRLGLFLPAVLCTLLWGSAFPAVKAGYGLFAIGADDAFTKVLFAGVRFGLAGLCVLLFSRAAGRRRVLPRRDLLPDVFLLSLTQTAVQYALFYISLAHISGSKGAMINATAVFFSVIFAHFMFKTDRMTAKKAAGCALGFCGVILVNLSGGIDGGFSLGGEGLMFLSAMCTGVSSPITKRITERGGDPMLATGWQLTIGGFLLLALGLAGGGRFGAFSPAGAALLTYLILLSAAAFTIWSILLKHYPTSRVAVYNFLVPVFGTLLSGVFLHESVLSLRNLLALLLVSGGIALAQGHIKKPQERL